MIAGAMLLEAMSARLGREQDRDILLAQARERAKPRALKTGLIDRDQEHRSSPI